MAEHRKRESVRSVCCSMLGQKDENHAFVASPRLENGGIFIPAEATLLKKIKHHYIMDIFTLSCTGGSTKISSFLETVCFVHQITVDRGGHSAYTTGQYLTGGVCGFIAGKVNNCCSDLLRQTDPAKRDMPQKQIAEFL